MSAYYNENDPAAAAWLRNLMRARVIADGVVDQRSIADVQPTDLLEFTQCHFFAGIGGWSYALRLADWPDDRPVWTGSCPCQPFSVAGKQEGENDERHLWPEFERLIRGSTPAVVFGEQVASKAGRVWLARVRADLEALGYGVGAADLCAAGVGAPHIRQRLYWLAEPKGVEHDGSRNAWRGRGESANSSDVRGSCGVADTDQQHDDRAGFDTGDRRQQHEPQTLRGKPSGVGNTNDAGPQGHRRFVGLDGSTGWQAAERYPWASSLGNWIPCADGKARRIKPGLEPLAHGIPGRVAALRGYGNAIVPQVAEIFIRSYEDCRVVAATQATTTGIHIQP